MLKVKDLTVKYGNALILDKINLDVDDGELVAVVGPNGAGKTALMRAISGLAKSGDILSSLSGTVIFDGKEIQGQQTPTIASMGLVLCPEQRHPFPDMTVQDNLLLGAYRRSHARNRKEIIEDLQECYKLFPDLQGRGGQIAGTLSGGEQQMLAIARSLMAKPKLLIIDEPSAGLAPLLRERVFKRINEIKQSGVTVLIVEQDISEILDIADRIYVMAHGEMVASGTKDELLKSEDIRGLYLGI
jgi:branched-chain amino acid transport system ATP-binding protein